MKSDWQIKAGWKEENSVLCQTCILKAMLQQAKKQVILTEKYRNEKKQQKEQVKDDLLCRG